MLTTALITIIVLALIFDYTNGFHDAASCHREPSAGLSS
jgi:hypothetical protein